MTSIAFHKIWPKFGRKSLRKPWLLALLLVMACSDAPMQQTDTIPQYGQSAEKPLKIMSLDLCADYYLHALAEPQDIAALSRFAHDPTLSIIADQAKNLPYSRGTLEEIRHIAPDIVLTGPWQNPQILTQLSAMGIKTAAITQDRNSEEILQSLDNIAAAIGKKDKGERLKQKFLRDMAEVKRRYHDLGKGQIAAHYQRQGYVTGRETLLDNALSIVGLTNLASQKGYNGALLRLSLEDILIARPDWLIMDETALQQAHDKSDKGVMLLSHPALANIYDRNHVGKGGILPIDMEYYSCGGLHYPQAIALLGKKLSQNQQK